MIDSEVAGRKRWKPSPPHRNTVTFPPRRLIQSTRLVLHPTSDDSCKKGRFSQRKMCQLSINSLNLLFKRSSQWWLTQRRQLYPPTWVWIWQRSSWRSDFCNVGSTSTSWSWVWWHGGKMVWLDAGESGLGKSTFLNSLFSSHLIDSSSSQHSVGEFAKQTTEITTVSHGIDRNVN